MPLPSPQQDEKKDDFISRCIKEMESEKERFPQKSQRVAICYSQWDKDKEEKD